MTRLIILIIFWTFLWSEGVSFAGNSPDSEVDCSHVEFKTGSSPEAKEFNDRIIREYFERPESLRTPCFEKYIKQTADGFAGSLDDPQYKEKIEELEMRIAGILQEITGNPVVYRCPEWKFKTLPGYSRLKKQADEINIKNCGRAEPPKQCNEIEEIDTPDRCYELKHWCDNEILPGEFADMITKKWETQGCHEILSKKDWKEFIESMNQLFIDSNKKRNSKNYTY